MKKLFLILCAAVLASVSAFAGTNFRDSIFDYQNDVKDFSDDGINENVVDGRFVQASPLDLQVGDIFIDVDGTAQKVVSITKKKNEIIIDTIEPNIREVFLFLYSPDREIEIGDDLMISPYYEPKDIIVEEEPESRVTVENPKDGYNWENPQETIHEIIDSGSLLMGLLEEAMPKPTMAFGGQVKLDGKKPKSLSVGGLEFQPPEKGGDDRVEKGVETTIEFQARFKNNGISITPGFCLPYTSVNTHGTWKFWKWTLDYHSGYARVAEKYDVQLGVGIGVQVEGKKQWKFPLFTTTPSGTGVAFEVKWGPSISGSIVTGFEYYTHLIKESEAGCTLDGLLWYCVPTSVYTKVGRNDRYSGVYFYGALSGEFAGHVIPIISVQVAGMSIAEFDFDVYNALRGEIMIIAKNVNDPEINMSEKSFQWHGSVGDYLGGTLTVGFVNNAISKQCLAFEVPTFSLNWGN